MMPKKPTPLLPLLARTEVVRAVDGTWTVLGIFDGMAEHPVLARLGEDRQHFQDDHALQVCAETVATTLLDIYRQGWITRNKLGDVFGHLSIKYDETDIDPVTSYRRVEVRVTGRDTHTFASGDPVEDWAAAQRWATRNVGDLMESSSCFNFVHDVAGYRFDDNGGLVVDDSETLDEFKLREDSRAGGGSCQSISSEGTS